jgi:biopolymer transport protein ExbB/TolQ
MQFITDSLYWISTGLMVPVVVLLIILFLRSLLLIGGFFGRYASYKKVRRSLDEAFSGLTSDGIEALVDRLPKKTDALVVVAVREIIAKRESRAAVGKVIANFEVASDKELGVSRTLSKMGPMLGLMGTLIPMGPALVGLSTGDISSMAYNMQVAFATTVVGLFTAAVGHLTLQVRQRWALQDLSDLEYLSDLIEEGRK